MRDNNFNQIINVHHNSNFLEHLHNLKFLKLSGCQLETLPANFFMKQTKLTKLDLNNNNLETWSTDLFRPIQGLEYLDLGNNKIQIITNESTKYWKNLTYLNLVNNPFNCWCDLLWFMDWIRETRKKVNIISADQIVCGSPSIYNNTKLLDIKENELRHFCWPL